jgi:nitroreductase
MKDLFVPACTGEVVVDIEEALYTTRAMRRVRPDPIPLDVQAKILDAAIRAPTGGNAQNWRCTWIAGRGSPFNGE